MHYKTTNQTYSATTLVFVQNRSDDFSSSGLTSVAYVLTSLSCLLSCKNNQEIFNSEWDFNRRWDAQNYLITFIRDVPRKFKVLGVFFNKLSTSLNCERLHFADITAHKIGVYPHPGFLVMGHTYSGLLPGSWNMHLVFKTICVRKHWDASSENKTIGGIYLAVKERAYLPSSGHNNELYWKGPQLSQHPLPKMRWYHTD
jgi:hypothetical protein